MYKPPTRPWHMCAWLLGFILTGQPCAVAADRDMSFTDPLRPADWHGQSQSLNRGQLQVQAIIAGKSGALAVINGRTLQTGDRIGNLTVTRIAEGQVHLRADSGESLALQPNTLAYPPIARP